MLINKFIKAHRFTEHPFSKVAAEKEDLLDMYFVEPRYFSEALGDANHPKSYVVFGPRGGGKSAVRSMIERYCDSESEVQDIGGRVLSITYDDFTALRLGQINTITLSDHINEILKRGVSKLAVCLVERGIIGEHMPLESRGLLRWYIDEYMSDLSRIELDSIIKSLESRNDKMKALLSNAMEMYNVLISVLKLERVEPKTPTDTPRQKRDAISSIHIMETFTKLASTFEYEAVYVLVDKVDETDSTGGNSYKAARLVSPMLTNIRLLEIDRGAFKFFLWENVKSHFGEELRTDRITMKPTEWSDADLQRMFLRRIAAYSLKKASVESLFEASIQNKIIKLLVSLSFKSPRDLNRIMESIFAEAAVDATPDDLKINWSSIKQGINRFSTDRVYDLYTQEVVNRILRLEKEIFTISDVAATFKVTGGKDLGEDIPDKTATNKARNIVEKWKGKGLISQVESGFQIDKTGRRRPVNQYGILDPRVIYLIDPVKYLESIE
ncbi:hypothetical protein HQN87_08455 [Paenibacillus tritici]|uniref:ATP-binding protein n=1 Tax=Paenibacillus tritici TaxID=1873425 RepID=A0ABX2DNE1_9BACL|nr:hypothetical protein [Paenibacillus tritici]NQX45361.1 hypothetical protein [Paenibacillus tritici]